MENQHVEEVKQVEEVQGGVVQGVEEAQTSNSNNIASKEKTNQKMFLFGLVGFIIITIIGVAGVGVYRVYALTATDPFTEIVAKILRLPAVKVDDKNILYSDYLEDLKAINKMKEYDKTSGGNQLIGLTDEQLSDQALWNQANKLFVATAASKAGVSIAQTDVDVVKSNFLSNFKDTAEAEKALQDRFGWDLKKYEDRVIRSHALSPKLYEYYLGTREKEAQKVLDEIKNGSDFAAMAKKYGSDGTAPNGGDLGWFKKGDMVPSFEAAVFALKKGELSQKLVTTSYGFHIIRLDDTKKEKVKDANGKMVDTEQVRASHILFNVFATPDDYVNDLLYKATQQANTRMYIKVHDPFTEAKKKTS